jgi:predicted secreted protein
MANPTSNFNWQMPTPTDLVTDLPADFEVFGQAVDSSLADLLGGTTGQVLAKNSNSNMDFVWVAQDDSNAIQNAIVDAKGDLIGATAADTPARLAVGTNGQVLTADSAATTGLAWATPAAAGLTFISETTFSGVASQSFNSVFTSTYANYLITYNIVAADSAAARGVYLRYRASGSDTTTTYAGNMGGWNIEGTGQSYNEVVASTTFTQLGWSSSTTEINRLLGQATIYNPNVASQYTALIGQAISEKAGAYKGGYQTYSMQTATTQFDGFTLYASAGNIGGTVRIYGIRNS